MADKMHAFLFSLAHKNLKITVERCKTLQNKKKMKRIEEERTKYYLKTFSKIKLG